MKKIIALIAAGIMAVSATGCQKTADPKKLAEEGKMVIGYTIIDPLNYDDENGELTGFETDFAKAVCKEMGVEPVFQQIDWNSKETELNSMAIDCIWNGLTINKDRLKNMSITNPYLENRQVIVVKEENADKFEENVDGAKIVAEAGSAGEELAKKNEFFASSDFATVESQATALLEVLSGTADAAIIDYVMAASSTQPGKDYENLKLIDKDFDSEQYGIAFRKGSELTKQVNDIIDELADNGTLSEIAAEYGLEDLLIVE